MSVSRSAHRGGQQFRELKKDFVLDSLQKKVYSFVCIALGPAGRASVPIIKKRFRFRLLTDKGTYLLLSVSRPARRGGPKFREL